MTIFLMLCLIITSLSVSIISSVIERQELLMKEENLGYNYSKISEYDISPISTNFADSKGPKSLKNLGENEYYKKYETCFLTGYEKDKLNLQVAIINVKFNYFDKLSVLSVIDSSNMKNSVAMGINLYNTLGKPKTIKIFNREYKVSHILGSKIDHTAFDDFIVLNYRILKEQDKENFIISEGGNILKFLNINNLSSLNNKITISFNGPNNECQYGKTDFVVQSSSDGVQLNVKKAYETQKDSISNKNLLIIIGICNIIIVSTFWIVDRRKEIAIRKAFGASKKSITLMLFKELFTLAILSSIISVILQYIFIAVGGKFFNYNIKPSFTNLMAVSISAFFVSIIAAIIPVRNALHMEISKCLKS